MGPKPRSTSSKWRAVSLLVMGMMLGAIMLAPVSAGPNDPATKSFVRKTAKKIAKKVATNKVNQLAPGIANQAVQADNASSEGIFASFKNGPVDVPNSLATIASLNVPPGNYAIFAKLWLEDIDPGFDVSVHCRLSAGGNFDDSMASADNPTEGTAGVGDRARIPMALQVVNTFASSGTITLQCTDENTIEQARFIKITAIRAASVTNAVSPTSAARAGEGRG